MVAPHRPGSGSAGWAGLADLNPAQREAVSIVDGPLLVLAGAGTGKTRVITYRIAHLLSRGVPPEEVLAVTFTNKAAREMRERVGTLLRKRPHGLILSTFHALGLRILRAEAEQAGLRGNFSIYDSSDQLSLLRDALRDIRGAATAADAHAVHAAISLAKNRFLLPEDLLDAAADDRDLLTARAYARYQEALSGRNAVDFDDLILRAVRLLEEREEVRERYQRRFRYLLIDEYQDTNGSQYRFTRALVGPERNLCVVGDDDQSIYGFRGAEMDKILKFERDFPGARVVKLELNYRSTAAILDLANAVISSNSRRRPKELRSTVGPGVPVEWVLTPDEGAEADYVVERIQELVLRERVDHAELAVLLRSSFQARPFEEKLRLKRIPYTLVGGQSFYDRKEIRDVLAYWKAAHNPRDDLAVLRIINFPARGIGAQTLAKIDQVARSSGKSILEALEALSAGEDGLPPRAREPARDLCGALQHASDLLSRGQHAAMCRSLLEEVGYRQALGELYPDPLALQARWAAVEDLLQGAREWEDRRRGETFGDFLGALSLEADDVVREEKDARRGVLLMTLHSAKGLEFPVVFLAGVEEDLLPHRKAVEEGDAAIEEERRLFYVGITRARRRLFLTGAATRTVAGQARPRLPSRFLGEVGDRDLFRKTAYEPDALASPEKVEFYLELYRSRRQVGSRKSEVGRTEETGDCP